MKTVKDVLVEAKALLLEKGWTKGAGARDARGMSVPNYSPQAARFCVLGAIECATMKSGELARADALFYGARDSVARVACVGSVVTFNDAPMRTKEEVIAVLDKAIASEP